MKIQLEPGKSVEVLSPSIKEWGIVTVLVKFVEIGEERIYEIDPEQQTAWLKANPTKKVEDFYAMLLLPLYDRLFNAKTVKDSLVTVI